MSRATSTVVDVTVFLLFVGAAATALLGGSTVDSPRTTNPATEQAHLLTTSTASVEYEIQPPTDPPPWTTNATVRRQRTAHGTVAELLSEATISSVRVDGERLSAAGVDFEWAVAETTRTRLRDRASRSSVRVRWTPYRDAPVNATMQVGEGPPPSVDVAAETVSVPAPIADVRERAISRAVDTGYEGVATVVASTVVDGLFPPAQTNVALEGDYPSNHIALNRYRRLASLTEAGPLSIQSTLPRQLNDRLTVALAGLLERDMRSRFDSPTAAARTVQTGSVQITVRTWSS